MPRPPRGGALALAPPPLLSLPVLRWPAHAADPTAYASHGF
jgi:hypothetical protein